MFKHVLFSCAVGALVFASSLELYARGPGGGGRGGRSGGASRGVRSGGGRSGGGFSGGIKTGGLSGGVKPGGLSGGARPQSLPSAPGRSNVSPLGGGAPGNFNLPATGARPGGLGDVSPRSLNPSQRDLQNFLDGDRSAGQHRPADVEGRRSTAASHLESHTHPYAQHWQQHAGSIAQQAHQAYHASNFPFASHWANAHPYAAKYGWAVHGYHPLTTATWAAAVAWTAGATSGTYSYNYPATVVYESGDVYIDGQAAGSAATYSQQATTLAATGAQAKTTAADEWLPLGVFAIAPDNVQQPIALAQLAVNKSGVIDGAYYDTISDSMQPIQGSIDAKTGRAAWSVAGNQKATFETTLQALTRDNGPLLLHLQGSQLQHWSLARMKK